MRAERTVCVLAEHSLWVAGGDTALCRGRNLGKLWTRVRQRGKHRTAEKSGGEDLASAECEAPAFCRLGSSCAAALMIFCRSGEEGLGGIPGRLLLTRQRQHPLGASGLDGGPSPAHHKYSITALTHPF